MAGNLDRMKESNHATMIYTFQLQGSYISYRAKPHWEENIPWGLWKTKNIGYTILENCVFFLCFFSAKLIFWSAFSYQKRAPKWKNKMPKVLSWFFRLGCNTQNKVFNRWWKKKQKNNMFVRFYWLSVGGWGSQPALNHKKSKERD